MATVADLRTDKQWAAKVGNDRLPALGFLEVSSISRGLYLTDVVLKKAPVRMITSQPISGGKHVVLYFGDVASVEESHREALEQADGTVEKEVLIPAVHAGLTPFLEAIWKGDAFTGDAEGSVSIIESNTLSGAILAADRALKAAEVYLCRMRLGQGIGGKAYFVVSGRQDDVEAATDAAEQCLKELESFCRRDVIPMPQEEALAYF